MNDRRRQLILARRQRNTKHVGEWRSPVLIHTANQNAGLCAYDDDEVAKRIEAIVPMDLGGLTETCYYCSAMLLKSEVRADAPRDKPDGGAICCKQGKVHTALMAFDMARIPGLPPEYACFFDDDRDAYWFRCVSTLRNVINGTTRRDRIFQINASLAFASTMLANEHSKLTHQLPGRGPPMYRLQGQLIYWSVNPIGAS